MQQNIVDEIQQGETKKKSEHHKKKKKQEGSMDNIENNTKSFK